MRGKIQYANQAERLKSRLYKQSLPSQTNFKRDLPSLVQRLKSRLHQQSLPSQTNFKRDLPSLVQRLKSRLHKPSLPSQTHFKGDLPCLAPRFGGVGYIAGFTLLEVIIVVTIIAIFSAIALPNWIAFVERQRLNTAQEQVYLALRFAQSEAKRTKIHWQASFREDNGVVQWAIHPAGDNHNTANWNSLDSQIKIDPETTYKLLSTGIRRVEFGFMGEVKSVPLGRITLSSKKRGKIKRCVFVSTLLGALRTAKENPTEKDGKYCY